jgi:hypothetical protein
MAVATGDICRVCHHAEDRAEPGNCYLEDLKTLVLGGAPIAEAIAAIDGWDSDGDGVSNGEEATMPRADLPGEIGYNMGLVGASGTDPCAVDPDEVVTGQPETPPAISSVPAVSEWGLVVMILSVMVVGTMTFKIGGRLSRCVSVATPARHRLTAESTTVNRAWMRTANCGALEKLD